MEKILLIYKGRRFNGKELIYEYEDQSGNKMLFGRNLGAYPVGSLVECTKIETGVQTPYDFCGTISDGNKISDWSVLDRTAYDTYTSFRESKKKTTTKYDKALSEIKDAYRLVPYSQRQIFINRLIIEITK